MLPFAAFGICLVQTEDAGTTAIPAVDLTDTTIFYKTGTPSSYDGQ